MVFLDMLWPKSKINICMSANYLNVSSQSKASNNLTESHCFQIYVSKYTTGIICMCQKEKVWSCIDTTIECKLAEVTIRFRRPHLELCALKRTHKANTQMSEELQEISPRLISCLDLWIIRKDWSDLVFVLVRKHKRVDPVEMQY